MISENTHLVGKKKACRLAKKCQKKCLAYKKFLLQKNVKKNTPFDKLPIIDKNNYIRKFPLEERLYIGKKISDFYMICTSTGSTGEPTIWPRDFLYDTTLIKPHSQFLENHFEISKKRSLILVSLGLGTSQAGTMHLKASWGACKDAKISVISPNGDPEMTLFLLKKLHSDYDQIICLGYPPLITDFIELAIKKHLPIWKWSLKIGITSENVSPLWRQEILKKIKGKGKDIVAWYGSTETGMIGFETPELNKIIQLTLDNNKLRQALFGTLNLPTFISVDFTKNFIEIVDKKIVITVDQVVPFVRYNLHDKGKLISGEEINNIIRNHKLKTHYLINKNSLYLAVYGRNLVEKVFSIEDIQYILDKLHLIKMFCNEFQFDEKKKKNSLLITLILYKRSHFASIKIKNKIKGKIMEELQKVTGINTQIAFNLVIKEKKELIGYKYGKLRYLLKT